MIKNFKEILYESSLNEFTLLYKDILNDINDWNILFDKYINEITPISKLKETVAGQFILEDLQNKTLLLHNKVKELNNKSKTHHLIPKEIEGEIFVINNSIIPEIRRKHDLVFKEKIIFDNKDRENVHKEVMKFEEVYTLLQSVIHNYNIKWKNTKYTVNELKSFKEIYDS